MKKIYIALTLIMGSLFTAYGQFATTDFTVRLNHVVFKDCELFSEKISSEFTAKPYFINKDTNVKTETCLQYDSSCSAYGPCGTFEIKFDETLGSVKNYVSRYIDYGLDWWEDDSGDRCDYNKYAFYDPRDSDDCLTQTSGSVAFKEYYYPNNVYGRELAFDYFFDNFDVKWNYRLNANNEYLEIGCEAKSITLIPGDIRAVPVNLVSGIQYEFITSSQYNRNMWFYKSDGYTLVASSIGTSFIYTPTSSGIYFIEVTKKPLYQCLFCVEGLVACRPCHVQGRDPLDSSTTLFIRPSSISGPIPDVSILPDFMAQCSANVTAPTARVGGATITAATLDPTFYDQKGTYNITWTYTDCFGKIASQPQTVIIENGVLPIACPTDIMVNNDAGVCGAVVTFAYAETTDNTCGIISNIYGDTTLDQNVGYRTGFPPNLTTELLTFSPATSGFITKIAFYTTNQSAKTGSILIQENFCAPPVTTIATSDVQTTVQDSWVEWTFSTPVPVVAGNEYFITTDIDLLEVKDSSYEYDDPTTGIASYYDDNYLLSDCVFYPQYEVASQITVIDEGSLPSTTITQTEGFKSGSTFPIGTTTNTFIRTEDGGNTSTCSFTVTVKDTEAPVINTLLDQSNILDGNCNAFNRRSFAQSFTPSASGPITSIEFVMGHYSGETTGLTLTLREGNNPYSGNIIATATGSLATGESCGLKSINLPLDTFVEAGNEYIFVVTCDNFYTSFSHSDTLQNTYAGGIGYVDVGSGLTNLSGTVDLEFNINVGQHTYQLIELDCSGTASIPAEDINNFAKDNCGIQSVILSKSTFTREDLGINEISVTIIDINGNETTTKVYITVVEKAPAIACQDITVQLDVNGMATIEPGDVLAPTPFYTVDQTGVFNFIDISASATSIALIDDGISGILPVGFNFNYYGNSYTDFYIGANGYITFNNDPSPPYFEGNLIPNISVPNNHIALAWTDLNPETGGVIRYATIGSAPNRILIVEYNTVNHYMDTDPVTVQAQLYEGSNVIEIHTTSKPLNPNLGSPSCTQGLENSDGTAFVSTPERNNSNYVLTNDFVSFTPVFQSDNCGVSSTTIDISTFDCSNIGPNTVTVTVTNANGNTNSCTATVTVTALPLTITSCADNVSIDNTPGECYGEVILIPPTLSAYCSVLGNALNFDGLDDNVSISNPVNSVFTIEAWIKTSATSLTGTYAYEGNGIVWSDVFGIANDFTLAILNDKLSFFDGSGDMATNGTTILNDDIWHHIAVIRNGTEGITTLYVDGLPDGSNSCDNVALNANPDIIIGGNPEGRYFNGVINEVRIWTVARTQAQIQNNMKSELSAETGLVASYHFNEGVAGEDNTVVTSAMDASGNNNNGILNNFALTGILSNWVDSAVSVTNNAPATYPIGDTTVTWTVTDAEGNESMCTQDIRVTDTEVPVIACRDITVQLDANGMATIIPSDIIAPASGDYTVDQTGVFNPIDISASATSVALSDDGVSGVLPVGFDFNYYGNSYTDFYIGANGYITFNNDPPPPGFEGNLMPNISVPNNHIALAWTDLNPETGGVIRYATIGTAPNRILIVEYNTVNHYLNTDLVTGQAQLYEGSNVIEIHTTSKPLNPSLGSPSCTQGVENSDGTTFVSTPGRNNSNYVLTNDFVSFIPAGATNPSDNCGVARTSIDISTFDCGNIGPNTVTLTVIDVNGNTNSCTANVTVVDVIPTITCPSDIVISNDIGQCGAIVNYEEPIDIINCTGVVTTLIEGLGSGSFFPIGTNIETYEVTDVSGNVARCSFTVTVNDLELPTFANCVANARGPILLPPYASITQQMVIDAAGMPSDNCGIPNISGVGRTSYANDGCLTTELWTVSGEDAFGNTGSCQVTFQYTEDTVAPIITCPDDITVSNDPGLCGSYVNIPPPVITDNCSDTYYEMSPPPGYLFPIGTTTVTVTAYDLPGTPPAPGTSKASTTSKTLSVGNSSQCTFTVTVNDTEAPVADCKNITVDLGVGGTYSLQASDIVGPNAKDNCGFSLSIPNTSFDCDDVGNTIDVLLTLTDPSGNLNSCTAQVTVTDSNSYCCQAPIITCPADVTVECDLSTEPGATGIATSTEGCGVVDISISDTFIPGCGITGRILRTWTATDEKGDTDVCIQTITIIDIMPPVIVCPLDIDVNNDPGLCSAVVNYTIDFSDNCSGKKQMTFEQTAGLPSGEAFPVGITTNTFVITDECGNSNTCSFKVTVTDNEAPVVECRPDVTVNNDAEQCSALLDSDQLKLLQSSDNCLYTTDERWAHISYSVAGASNFTGTGYDAGLNGTSFNVGISVLTYTMVDDAGHTSSDSMIITVVDNEVPVITCPADITTVKTSDGGTGDCYATLSLVSPTVSDNCTLIADITVTNDAPATFPIGDTTVKWTVKDATGNEQTCTQKVTVTDDEKPSITCPADITTSSDTGLCTASLDGFTATATDNCDTNPVITSTIGDIPVVWPYDFPFGDTEVVWRATDVAGNFSECTQTVTVDDIVTGTSVTVSPSTQQYSDKVTFDVTVTLGNCSGAGQAATYALIYVGTQLMGKAPLSVDGFGNLTGSLDAVLLENSSNGQMSPGVKTVKAVFMGINPNYTVNDATTSLTITQENANVDYTGQSLQATPSASASGATVVLSANIQDIADGYRGDIRNVKVMFVNRDSGSSPISGWIPVVDLVDPSDATLGAVSFSWGVDIGSSNAESYTVGIIVGDGYYKRNSSEDDTVITVYKPVGDFITGGGYIRPDASAGQYASTDGLKTNFGFNVGYNKKGNKLKGHMNVIFRRLESDGTVHVYQIKANAIQSLGVNISDPEAKFATFITKTNLTDITNPLNTISLGGNLILKVDMTDRGEPGTDDSIAINLTDGGTLVYSSNWTGISTSEMVLSAGNLLVHSGYSVGRTDATASTALDTGSGTFELQAWPNPSKDEFNIKLNSANKVDKVEIFVYDINGRQVYYNAGKAGEEYHFGSNLESGMYFVNITQANESRQVKLIKY